MTDPSDSADATRGLPTAPPTPLPPGWYADPQGHDGTSLRYWDGSDWTDKTAATSAQDVPRRRLGVRRSLLFWIAGIALVLVAAASGWGVWTLAAAQDFEDKTTTIENQTGTLQEETDELNAT